MPQVQNSSTIKEIRTAGGLSVSEGFPTSLGNQIVPVININPKDYRTTNVLFASSSTSSGNIGIGTTSTTKDTFITSIQMSMAKDATCDVASGAIYLDMTFNDVVRDFAYISILTLTAQSQTVFLQFANPVRVARGSSILIGAGAHTVGLFSKAAAVHGFEVEPFENL